MIDMMYFAAYYWGLCLTVTILLRMMALLDPKEFFVAFLFAPVFVPWWSWCMLKELARPPHRYYEGEEEDDGTLISPFDLVVLTYGGMMQGYLYRVGFNARLIQIVAYCGTRIVITARIYENDPYYADMENPTHETIRTFPRDQVEAAAEFVASMERLRDLLVFRRAYATEIPAPTEEAAEHRIKNPEHIEDYHQLNFEPLLPPPTDE